MFDWGLVPDRRWFSTVWVTALFANLWSYAAYMDGWVAVTEASKVFRDTFAWDWPQVAAVAAAPVAWATGAALLWRTRTSRDVFVGGLLLVSLPVARMAMDLAGLYAFRFTFGAPSFEIGGPLEMPSGRR